MITKVYTRPKSLKEKITHYCPGCNHGIIHRLIAEVIDELGIVEKTVGIAPVGCAVLAYEYFNFDFVQASHGRAPAVATGIKRAHPELFVFTYQGDGDLAAIGTTEIVHSANRGEKISVIFVNNGVYGMTGGQMAPTTLIGQKTTTTPLGRNPEFDGYPIKISEMLATLEGSKYIARVAVNTPANIRRAKAAIMKAFKVQLNNIGFSFVEILSTCPSGWGVSPLKALKLVEERMIPYYPLGEIKISKEVEEWNIH
ncbi:MAG: thiamine pyrophosphate-dependent enzyme [Dictyoglomaceae bacterium]